MTARTISNIPIEQLYEHPTVQELLNKIGKLESQDLEKIKVPYVIKDKILMSPGVWNEYFYSADSIHDAFLKSEWSKKEVRSLFLDHEDARSSEWIGEVINPKMKGDDLIGDLIIVDKPTAMKLAYGAKMGISPKVSGGEEGGKMLQFKYDNFSVVINPAVKTAYINNQQKEVKKMAEEEAKEQPKEEAKTEEPKEEVKEVKEEVKEEASEEKAVENADKTVDEILSAFTEIKELAFGDIAKKAKEIRKKNPDMKWTDAIKEAAKTMPKKKETAEMGENDILKKAIEILQKKNKSPEEEEEEKKPEEKEKPEEEKVKKPEEEEKKKKMSKTNKMSRVVEEQKRTIQELAEKLDKVEEKLNEPAKASVKSEELSASADPDEGFLKTLKSI